MNVDVIGGGPGGAYAALLAKKAHPDWSVSVYEAFPAATTYGWGIVLPGKIYPVLREADEPTAAAIEAANTSWDPIDNYHRGQRVRCAGHPYTSVMRADLLEILQGRCRELGVDLHFETEADPVERRAESDLLVGADGITSPTRDAFADAFDPSPTRHSDVYAWFGTDRSFPALSHIYVKNDDGVWHGAAYPGSTDTFIVDAAEETWRAAGFEGADEAVYIDYLEDVFADSLQGHGLRSKEDRWRHFVTVHNGQWHDDDVALLGDAAATAHYTIGSGTRMAMESAIGLAEGLARHPDDLPAALDWYQAERKPHVAALQSAAELSVTHFENLERYIDSPPMQLAFLYLTRTGYNSYEALAERDPGFVDDLDRWFARAAGASVDDSEPVAEPIDQPLELAGLALPGRVAVSPSAPPGVADGRIDGAYGDRLAELATRGVGLVLTDPVAPSADGRISAGTPGLYADGHASAWAAAVDAAADAGGAPVGIELVHAGRRSGTDGTRLAPSAIPYEDGDPTPRRMDESDLDTVRASFVAAARRADEAGVEFLSVHAGRGYLLGSFLSPLSNERTDRYGGSLESRLRYPRSVVEAVRAAWPADKPLAVTLCATDCVEGGFAVEDAFVAARAMREAGVDVVAPVSGGTVPDAEPPDDLARTRLYAHWIKHEADVPTLSTARVTTRDGANTIVAAGRADLCRLYPDGDGSLAV